MPGAPQRPYNSPMKSILRQAGAIPFRRSAEGLQVLLITSRDRGRWVIPKGGIKKGFTPAQAAEAEAYEEAGVKGSLSPDPLGKFTYTKLTRNGVFRAATVLVYAMRVEKQLEKWPEQAQRRFKWMPIAEAVALVQEDGMATLLLRLQRSLQTAPFSV